MSAEGTVFVTKRYQVFTDMIPRLIAKGVSFVEIGGNDEILVTCCPTTRSPRRKGRARCSPTRCRPIPRSAAPG